MLQKIKENGSRLLLGGSACVASALVCAAPCFAADTVDTFEITATMVEPIVDAINSGLTTLVPIGLGVMGAMVGVGLIPRIIYKFL